MRNDYTHICLVLDRSGSMAVILTDTIGGFNSFLKAQRETPSYATITLRMFAQVAFVPEYQFKPVAEAALLSTDNYRPGGQTALYDAIGLSIKETGEQLSAMPESERPSKVVFAILTDGYENASRLYGPDVLAQMIKHQTETYGWTFVFLGANQDAILTAAALNIAAGQTMTFAANAVGTASAYDSLSEQVRSYRLGVKDQFEFDSRDRDAQTNAGVDPKPNAS